MKTLVTISDSAAERIASILDQHPSKILRLGVNNKGCSGNSYTFDLIDAEQVKKFDEIVPIGQHKVAVDGGSLLKLIGSTLDWHTDKFGSKFVWHNPLVTNTCGCGESVAF